VVDEGVVERCSREEQTMEDQLSRDLDERGKALGQGGELPAIDGALEDVGGDPLPALEHPLARGPRELGVGADRGQETDEEVLLGGDSLAKEPQVLDEVVAQRVACRGSAASTTTPLIRTCGAIPGSSPSARRGVRGTFPQQC